jgi:ADP-heptose:LPS heptosyltransferase
MIDLTGKRILISRTDSIGDVMLTLPICSWLKEQFPDVHLAFLGKGYTRSVVSAYKAVDEFLDWKLIEQMSEEDQQSIFSKYSTIIHVFPNKKIAKLAKKASIENRVGTSHRTFHLLTCTHRLNFTRKRSDLHESQLNFELVRPFGLKELPRLVEVISRTDQFDPKDEKLPEDLSLKGYTILRPKSQGSAREWPLKKYMVLAEKLAEDGKKVVFTGTESEGQTFRTVIPEHENIIDSTGRLTLEQLMTLIKNADNLVACSTGPLHISGYLNVNTIGLFSPKRPIHPGRWKALGNSVKILVNDQNCPTCEQGKECDCIEKIEVDDVYRNLV